MRAEEQVDVVVIGAGISGLAVTHYLRARGISTVTLDATDRPGGVIESRCVEGRVLEYGPQRLRLSEPVETLVDDLSIAHRVTYAQEGLPLYILRDRELHEVPRTLGTFLSTDLLSTRGKARVLAELFTRRGDPSESAGGLLRRKFGEEAYRNLIEPLLGGIYASDPDTMPAGHAIGPLFSLEERDRRLILTALKHLWKSHETSPIISFDEGLAVLPRAIYQEHREAIHLESTVTGISRTSDGEYLVSGDDIDLRASHVVVTTPAWVAAELLETVHGVSKPHHLDALHYNPLAIVHLDASHGQSGMGYQIRRDEGTDTLGVTWNDVLFDRDGVHTAFLGGAWDPSVVDADPAALGEKAREEFEQTMGVSARVLDATIIDRAIPAYDRSWNDLHRVSLPDRLWLCTNYTGRIGVPGRLRHANRVANAIERDLDDGKRL